MSFDVRTLHNASLVAIYATHPPIHSSCYDDDGGGSGDFYRKFVYLFIFLFWLKQSMSLPPDGVVYIFTYHRAHKQQRRGRVRLRASAGGTAAVHFFVFLSLIELTIDNAK